MFKLIITCLGIFFSFFLVCSMISFSARFGYLTMSKSASDKLLKLLYSSTVTGAGNRATPVVKAMQAASSIDLNGFLSLENSAFSSNAIEKVMEEVDVEVKSNILKFKCSNCLISSGDFYSIYPRENSRRYKLPPELKNGVKFTSLKARYPLSLSFADAYYLIFPNRLHAAAYYMETKNKSINGLPMSLQFVIPKRKEMSYMHSNLLDFGTQPLQPRAIGEQEHGSSQDKRHMQTPAALNQTGATLKENSLIKLIEQDPDNYASMLKLIDLPTRKATVLVKNLPLGIAPSALSKLLWDYDFPVHIPLGSCFKQIKSDALKQVHVMLIRFADEDNANRFVRSFHGTKWQGLMKSDVTKLHEPLLCETLN